MFCPKCGKPDQTSETYCRQCGLFLPDLDTRRSSEKPPEMHIAANAVLSGMTIFTTVVILILLFAAFAGKDFPVLIYPAAGLLIAMAAWQIQAFWRTMLLRKQLKKIKPPKHEPNGEESAAFSGSTKTSKLLAEADFNDLSGASIIESTTRDLSGKKLRSSKSHH